ncbi:hypothetical protein OAG68_00465 [bacterium]|nr:hypothetical protein [bacterium]
MKSRILFVVLSVGMILPVCAMAHPFQDLDRINDIVNQARGLADGVRGAAPQAPQQQVLANPFSRDLAGGSVAGISVQAANGSAIDVGTDQVRINAGGMQFNIPRVGGGTVGVGNPVGPVGGAPLVNTAEAMEQVACYRAFADATQAFRNADFNTAISKMERASGAKQTNFDQFNSLCQFAIANYGKSAEHAYAAAAKNQVWDWRQLRANYGDDAIYSQQYLALQQAARQPTADVSVWFLLGYHHLMLGHRDDASVVLNAVLKKLPNDPVAHRMLEICRQGPPAPMGK